MRREGYQKPEIISEVVELGIYGQYDTPPPEKQCVGGPSFECCVA